MDITQVVLQTLANKIGKLEVENTCLLTELQGLQQQIQKTQPEQSTPEITNEK